MTDSLTEKQLDSLLDKESGVANDTRLVDGKSFQELTEILGETVTFHDAKAIGGLSIEDLELVRNKPLVYAPIASTFGGYTGEGLLGMLLGLVDTRTFKGQCFEATDKQWTHLVSVEVTPDREDFVFGLFGGGTKDITSERPVAIIKLGVSERNSDVLVLGGEYKGKFVYHTRTEGDITIVDLWYGATSRDKLWMTCANSTRVHTYGASCQEGSDNPPEGYFTIPCETVIYQTEFEEMVAPLRQELAELSSLLATIKK